jgi:hypothetical protein
VAASAILWRFSFLMINWFARDSFAIADEGAEGQPENAVRCGEILFLVQAYGNLHVPPGGGYRPDPLPVSLFTSRSTDRSAAFTMSSAGMVS